MSEATQMEMTFTSGFLSFIKDEQELHPEKVLKIRAFRKFHEENPHVYRLLRSRALEMRRKGRERYGIAGIFEVVRWHINIETTGEEFKLNNNHKAYYARLLMKLEPELEGFFNTRESAADEMEVTK